MKQKSRDCEFERFQVKGALSRLWDRFPEVSFPMIIKKIMENIGRDRFFELSNAEVEALINEELQRAPLPRREKDEEDAVTGD